MTAADAWQALMPAAVGVVQATAELCPYVPPLTSFSPPVLPVPPQSRTAEGQCL